MTLAEMLEKLTAGEMAGWAVVLLILFLSILQIAPIRINPWDSVFAWLGDKLNGKKLDEMEDQINQMWIDSHRQAILTFARECRHGVEHSADEWSHILTVADQYSSYCQKRNVPNGVVKADMEFLKELYIELSRDHRI